MDVHGNILRETSRTNHTFDTTALTAGLYFIKISSEEDKQVYVEKFIKR